MDFVINQAVNINVERLGVPFLFVKRKALIKTISKFYQEGDLIFEASLVSFFFFHRVSIKYQKLPHDIYFSKSAGFYELICNGTTLSLKMRYFKKPLFSLYMNGTEIGWITPNKFITVEGRSFIMHIDSKDELINIYFLLLFISQLRVF